MKTVFGRRSLLKGAGALAGAASVGLPSLALAQAGPIRIGITNALSGPNAVFGEANVIGQRLVVRLSKVSGVTENRPTVLPVRFIE